VVSSFVASRAEHSVSLWHFVVAAFPGANTVGEFSESIIKVSTPITAKQIQPPTATGCYSMFKLSKWFIAACAGIIHIAYLLVFVWIELLEKNSLNRGCHSHFSYKSEAPPGISKIEKGPHRTGHGWQMGAWSIKV
jgi:hypothetical protein